MRAYKYVFPGFFIYLASLFAAKYVGASCFLFIPRAIFQGWNEVTWEWDCVLSDDIFAADGIKVFPHDRVAIASLIEDNVIAGELCASGW